jgi:hypothetical protein
MKKAIDIIVPDLFLKYSQLPSNVKEDLRLGLVSFSANESDSIDPNLIDCILNGPKTINELTDGISFESYSFTKNDNAKLNLMGFTNVDFENSTKVVIVEFCQIGSSYSDGKKLNFGAGARMLMSVKKSRFSFGAKLDSPYQIAASAIFGKVTVKFNVKTFGITGPAVANLITNGALKEDTYTAFVNGVTNLIVESYKDSNNVTVKPVPLFL